MNALKIPAEELNLRVNTVDQAVSRGDVAGTTKPPCAPAREGGP